MKRSIIGVLFMLLGASLPAAAQMRAFGVDAQCEQQVTSATPECGEVGMAAMKSCFASKLSPRCAAQANAPSTTPRDAACQEEFKTVLGPCGSELNANSDRCLMSKLDAKCQAQYTAATRAAQAKMDRCQAEIGPRMEKMQRCLKMAAGADQNRCIDAIKAEKSSCDR